MAIILIRYMQDLNRTWIPACPSDRQLSNFAFLHDLPEPLLMGEVRIKRFSPVDLYLFWMIGRHFLQALTCSWFLFFWFQMCIGKETSWQAKEGAVMCKSLELCIFVILTQLYRLSTDHPLFIFTSFCLIYTNTGFCASKIAFYLLVKSLN